MASRLLMGLLLAAAPLPCLAAGVPPHALWGKSVSVSWSEDRVQRTLPDGAFGDRHIERRAEIYIAGSGRVFKRESAVDDGQRMYPGRGPNRSGSRDQVVGSEGGQRVGVSFSGTTLVITSMAERGARQMAVSFSEDFGSCQARVVNGREAGASTYSFRSLTSGREVEVRSVTTHPGSCSVSAGNVFER